MLNKKKGEILTENIIFIVLNLIFLTILILFVASNLGDEATLEEKYSKQIALIIDAAKPGMEIHLNMEDAIEEAEKNDYSENIVFVSGNNVNVKLREKGGNSYYFFNDVDVSIYPSDNGKDYVIFVSDYRENKINEGENAEQ